ncbi:MAG: aldo/keto reductase, partial [Acidobacteria bacterium]|nr:aldo/keto reductase [Acidobacteriota bacterium]
MQLTRRDVLKLGMGASAAAALRPFDSLQGQATLSPLITRIIPATGERLPVVGIGGRDWEAETPAIRAELKEVLRRFPELGGKLIDTATGYRNGASEALFGELARELGVRDKLFMATKINVSGKQAGLAQIELCFQRLQTDRLDLICVHNLRDTVAQLQNLREVKQAGRLRYIGVTTSSDDQYGELESFMRTEAMDFVQMDYAIDSRLAADRLLPLAADRGRAVMINLPFGRGRLFAAVRNQPLPDWAKEID